jgi:hypothetical protein
MVKIKKVKNSNNQKKSGKFSETKLKELIGMRF